MADFGAAIYTESRKGWCIHCWPLCKDCINKPMRKSLPMPSFSARSMLAWPLAAASQVFIVRMVWVLVLHLSTSYRIILSVVVLCNLGKNRVSIGISMPSLLSASRISLSLSSCANTLAFILPVCPPHAPQSRPAACGLLKVWLPCPINSTICAQILGD